MDTHLVTAQIKQPFGGFEFSGTRIGKLAISHLRKFVKKSEELTSELVHGYVISHEASFFFSNIDFKKRGIFDFQTSAHRICGTNGIFTYMKTTKKQPNVGKYTSPMDL